MIINFVTTALSIEPDAKEILTAAENGELDKVKCLLLKNPDLLECTDKDGYTPLHRACYGNHVEIVEVKILYFLFHLFLGKCSLIMFINITVTTFCL